jgi:hypothetical protein
MTKKQKPHRPVEEILADLERVMAELVKKVRERERVTPDR